MWDCMTFQLHKRVAKIFSLPSLKRSRQVVGLLLAVLSCWLLLGATPSWAGLEDDRFDGDIFALYAGNGSLIPPKVTLAQAFQRDKPTIMVLYVDDSSDCKQYANVLSQAQAFYGRVTDILAIRLDSLVPQKTYAPTDPGYYYKGVVPQTVVFDKVGKVLLNESGAIAYEQIDDVLRKEFDLLPRSESVPLKRRMVNEFTTELAK